MFEEFKKSIRQIYPLSEEDCEMFRDAFKVKTFSKNEVWTSPGQICREIGFVSKGIFRVYYLHDGKEINTHFYFEGEFVTDYQSFFSQESTRCYISALEESELVLFTHEKLEQAYSKSPTWERFGRIVAEQCSIETMQRAESFLFQNGEQRYMDLVKKSPHILDRIPLYHIASYIGLERESLSRLRKKIVQE